MVSQQAVSEVMNVLESKYLPREQPTVRRTSTRTRNPFKTLISCLLSLRTTDANCEVASKRLFAEAETPEETLALPSEKLQELIYSSGHYKRKTKILKSVSKELLERFDGQVPDTKEELLSIKYIGPKTANIVLSFAFDKDVIAVDTHLHRWPNRMGWVDTKTPEQTEQEYYGFLPKKYWKEVNTVVILFCKDICTPISPKCSICPIREYCQRVGVERSR